MYGEEPQNKNLKYACNALKLSQFSSVLIIHFICKPFECQKPPKSKQTFCQWGQNFERSTCLRVTGSQS